MAWWPDDMMGHFLIICWCDFKNWKVYTRQQQISFPQSSQVRLPCHCTALSRSNAAKSETKDLNFTRDITKQHTPLRARAFLLFKKNILIEVKWMRARAWGLYIYYSVTSLFAIFSNDPTSGWSAQVWPWEYVRLGLRARSCFFKTFPVCAWPGTALLLCLLSESALTGLIALYSKQN